MVLVALLMNGASADIVVEGSGGCIAREALELEVRTWVSEEILDEVDLRLVLDRATDPRTLTLEALRLGEDEPLWWQQLDVFPRDCEGLPLVVARIAEQQFAGVPSWRLPMPAPAVSSEVLLEVAGTLPPTPHGALGAAAGIRLARRWLWVIHVEGYLAAPAEVAAAREGGGVRGGEFAGLLAGTGLALDVPAGAASVRTRGWLAAGPHLAFGRNFGENYRAVRARAVASAQVDFVSTVGIRLGARVSTPLVRLGLYDEGQPEVPVTLEPPLRAGLVLGLGRRLRKE